MAAPDERRAGAYEKLEELILRMRAVPTPPALLTPEEMERDSYDGTLPATAYVHALPKQARSRRHFARELCRARAHPWCHWLRITDEQLADTVTYTAAPAEQRVVTLADGSTVTLDPALTVRMDEALAPVATRSWRSVLQGTRKHRRHSSFRRAAHRFSQSSPLSMLV